jgi:hypothetical protein
VRGADHVVLRRICQLVVVRQQSFDLVNIEYSAPLEEADLALDLIAGLAGLTLSRQSRNVLFSAK